MDSQYYLVPAVDSVSARLPEHTSPAAPPSLQAMAIIKHWHRDQEIIEQDGESQHWYCVISGSARQSLVRRDGRRQIADILLPGDFFGFETSGRHWLAVQAMTEGTITAAYPRSRIEELADRDYLVAREIRRRAFETIRRMQEQMLLVSTMTAAEKVHGFFRYMHGRLPVREDGIVLPVSRYDIADQLGISVETVCRAITSLREAGLIEMDGPRNIQLHERDDGAE
jgi:CRP/FNR family nitrogen fixation transcriptional regulator